MAQSPNASSPSGSTDTVKTTSIVKKSARGGDRIFRGLSVTASASVLLIMAAIAIFLVYKAVPALRADDTNFITTTRWFPDASPGDKTSFGIASLAIDTIITSIIATVVAVPVAIGIALFISFYAPRRLAKPLGALVELLAAVPSIVFGLWGFFFFREHLAGLVLWLDRYLGFIPLFDYRPDNLPGNQSLFTAGLVLAIMILPIVSSLARDIFAQTPTPNVEAALGLGATRWEMIRYAVLPFGRGGVASAAILGLGRALGETLAVTLILTAAYNVKFHLTENGGITFASNIALKYGEAGNVGTGALIASGLVLFLITLIVNSVSQLILRRTSGGA